ncbi:MAG: hypothetical protein A2Z34_01400 [Planctomycetes bacterium RBG_16_59_8]|nr:MAG: hypothetical protein A2Z34_01400 [Planctomycetes bacterium RBG_16_59_8]
MTDRPADRTIGRFGRRTILREVHLHFLWRNLLFRRDRLIAESGAVVAVEHPGMANREGGPDFRNARLRFAGSPLPVVGDVEIHLFSSGWESHRHAEDPAYANVVLHVAFRRDDESLSRRMSGFIGGDRAIPQLILEPYLAMSVRELVASMGRTVGGDRPALSRERLESLGAEALRGKIERYRRLLERHSPDEVLYREILIALGYKNNKPLFEELSRALSYGRLLAESGGDRDAIEAMLLAAAGFNRHGSAFRLNPALWRRASSRPTNRPERRIRAVAGLLSAGARGGLSSLVVGTDGRARERVEALVRLLRSTSGGGIGLSRARLIVFNVLLPFLAASGNIPSDRIPDYYRLPLPVENSRIRSLRTIYSVEGGKGAPSGEPRRCGSAMSAAEHLGLSLFFKKFGDKPPDVL